MLLKVNDHQTPQCTSLGMGGRGMEERERERIHGNSLSSGYFPRAKPRTRACIFGSLHPAPEEWICAAQFYQ